MPRWTNGRDENRLWCLASCSWGLWFCEAVPSCTVSIQFAPLHYLTDDDDPSSRGWKYFKAVDAAADTPWRPKTWGNICRGGLMKLFSCIPVNFFSLLKSIRSHCCWSLWAGAQGSPVFFSRAPDGAHTLSCPAALHSHTEEAESWESATPPDSKPSVP